MTSDSTDLRRFAAAALRYILPSGPVPGPLSRWPASHGARNHLFAGTTWLLKFRAAPSLPAHRELWGHANLPPGLAARLLAHAPAHTLRERAATAADWRALRALDLPVGHVMLQRRVPGLPVLLPTDAQLGAVARCVAGVHRPVRGGGPALVTGSHPDTHVRLAGQCVAELLATTSVDARTSMLLQRALRHAVAHQQRALRRFPYARVRTACHGDLRWHNMVWHRGGCVLVDLEHAGVGDPAVDLALMACRTPLSLHEELTVLAEYLEHRRRDRTFAHRYFAFKPLLGVLCATQAVLDLWDVAHGAEGVARDVHSHLNRRAPFVADELRLALERALRVGAVTPPRLRLHARAARLVKSARAWRGQLAVDGTALSGKSLVCAELAARLALPHINTGMLYRYAAWWSLQHGLDPLQSAHAARVARHLVGARAAFTDNGGLTAGGKAFADMLTTVAIEKVVAGWAVWPAIRKVATAIVAPWLQRNVVMEGRDVGSVLMPRAGAKLFVDATVGERARRLFVRAGGTVTRAQAASLVRVRDAADRERAHAPLVVPLGAWRLDTSSASAEVCAERVLTRLRRR